ncbi:PH and SEC7 domain-containing protein isoform X2 [Lutzomyia longipalpis]|uniref:PH and SEC7 domain-containing protein isoform X2 n=1 Tax=Lutzomyia longipalpis TaxID=7200 RepID=UPI0024846429|nr:PH and SEC7 domain-containing protein isoform X2 [Lutzomyia longipalpis]
MEENFEIILRKSDNSLGFSLLGSAAGLPHVIYDIVENSPAAESGEVEAGDVIVKVNGTDVHRYTTKEVLKCLRLSQDPVTLELRRDPNVKAHVRKYLEQTSNLHPDAEIRPFSLNDSALSPKGAGAASSQAGARFGHNPAYRGQQQQQQQQHSEVTQSRPSRIPQIVRGQTVPPVTTSHAQPTKSAPQSPHGNKIKNVSHIPSSNGTNNNNNSQIVPPANNKARFEAYMMTGDLILNLSRTPQSSGLITSHAKKVDSLRDSPSRISRRNGAMAPQAKYDSSPSSPTYSTDDFSGDSNNSNKVLIEKDNNSIIDSIETKASQHSGSINSVQQKSKSVKGSGVMCNSTGEGGGGGALSANDSAPHRKDMCSVVKSSSSHDSAASAVVDNRQWVHDGNHATSDSVDCAGQQRMAERGASCSSQMMMMRKQPKEHTFDKSYLPTSSVSSSSSTVKSDAVSSPDVCFSVPTSPISMTTPVLEDLAVLKKRDSANSVPTSPESAGQPETKLRRTNNTHNGVVRKCDAAGFRTSRSEDHLQQSQRDGLSAVIPIDIDEDVNSSLNTLLDTRHDSEDSQSSDRDRIVWTYNAPIIQQISAHSSTSHSSSISSSPQHTNTPASPTSVSSSVMSSNSSSKGEKNATNSARMDTHQNLIGPPNGDHSVSEAVSNISSPDYQDEDNLLSSKDMAAMAISDPSDSDSTILVSDTVHRIQDKDNKITIHLRQQNSQFIQHGYSELKNSEDELATLTEDPPTMQIESSGFQDAKESSPPVSDDGSDVDSLHSYHYSPKAVDMPSAVRLAKRLYALDGFKKSDVSRHLSKNNDFTRAVADEYLKYFNFERLTLDEALRQFLQQFSLSGETQERERVLVHFSKRYLDCNPGTFNSQDAVHTLTCAIMLLNTDLHGQNIGRKMTCSEFIDNLSELNDGENFPKDILKYLYQAIKNHPLEWALDEESPDQQKSRADNSIQGNQLGTNSLLDTMNSVAAIEYKKGYVMRKCCYDSNYKKSFCGLFSAPFGKRSWKMFYCTLRDLVLYLHKDEHGFRKNQMSDNVHNAIRIHHALATKATDYTKKQHVFRLQTADQSEYLFQTSDSKELQSWIDTINCVCASFSAPPLEGGVGSQKRFQRPLLPSNHTKLLLREQLLSHDTKIIQLENEIEEHRRGPVPTKGLPLQNYKEKESFLLYELKRYKTYSEILSTRMMSGEQDIQNAISQQQTPAGLLSDEGLSNTYHNSLIANTGGGFQVGPNGGSGQNAGATMQQPPHAESMQMTMQQQQQPATNRKENKYKT